MLWLLEHRDEATDEEIRLLMDDDEVRDVYELMVLTDEAYRWADEPRRTLWWRKVAAAVAIVLLTGVAVAAVGHFSMKAKPDLSDYACVMDEQAMTAIGDTVPQVVSGGTADICVFTDRELKDVLAVVACHYGVGKVGAFPLQVYEGTKLADDIGLYGLTLKEDAFGIPEVVDNPTHDFEKMQKLAETI